MKKYTFYFHTGYVNGGVEETFTAETLGISEKTTEIEKNVMLDDAYKEFLANYDSGWYEHE